MAEYRIKVRNKDLQFFGEVSRWIRIQVALYFNEISRWMIELDGLSEEADLFRGIAAAPDNGGKGGIFIERNGYFLLSGPMTEISEAVSPEDGDRLIISGSCDLQFIADHLALPHPQYFRSPFMTTTGTATGSHTDYIPDKATPSAQYASWHIHTLVRTNIGEAAPAQRPPLSFLTTRDNSVGYLIPAGEHTIARGENLFELCQSVANYSDYKGYPIRMTAYQYQSGNNPDGSPAYKIRFECLASQVKPDAIFSPDLGNIIAWTYTRQRPEANKILMAGSGEGRGRKFAFSSDPASQALHGTIEAFEEYTGSTPNTGNGSDPDWTIEKALLAKEIDAKLAEYAEKTIFEFAFQETPTIQYGRDFQIGDIVRVQLRGQSTTDVVRAVSFDVGGDEERIEIIVGQQSAISRGLRIFDDVRNLKYRYNGLTKRNLGE